MFFWPLATDSAAFAFHVNGVAGALATLPLYLFIRQRTNDERAGFLCALVFALHPMLARFAPTDSPYSLMLVTWFTGLAFLSDPQPTSRSMAAGIVCLGIAEGTRLEGLMFVLAAIPLLGFSNLARIVRAFGPSTAMGAIIAGILMIVHAHTVFPAFAEPGHMRLLDLVPSPRDLAVNTLGGKVLQRFLLAPLTFSGPRLPDVPLLDMSWARLSGAPIMILAAAVAGLTSMRWRVGLGVLIATAVVIAPVCNSGETLISIHRLVPAAALQATAVGLGLCWVLSPLECMSGRRWLPGAAGAIAVAACWWPTRGVLTERFFFNEEYDIVRSHLAPGGRPLVGCTLLSYIDASGGRRRHPWFLQGRPRRPDPRLFRLGLHGRVGEAWLPFLHAFYQLLPQTRGGQTSVVSGRRRWSGGRRPALSGQPMRRPGAQHASRSGGRSHGEYFAIF
jgi:hypothetical protein